MGFPVWGFQMMQVPSLLVVAMRSPSGCQAAPVTRLVWPVRVVMGFPVWGFQMMQVPSQLVVAMRSPSGCQATPVTRLVWPGYKAVSRPVGML